MEERPPEEARESQESDSSPRQNFIEVQCEAANLMTMYISTFDESTYNLAVELSEAGMPVRPIPEHDMRESDLPAIYYRTRRIIGEEAIRAFKNERLAKRED